MIILMAPISLDIFKARMLPKADKNQVYLWVDAPRNTTIDTMTHIHHDIETFLLGYKKIESSVSGEVKYSRILPKELQIIENLSTSVGDRFVPDFANLFRGGDNRILENQISMRINLSPSHDRDMNSEAFVIALRPILTDYLIGKYSDITLRLLEDPPGPPTQATFHMKLQGEE